MSKLNDPGQLAEANIPGAGVTQSKDTKGPMGSPPDPFPRPSQGRSLGENQVKPDSTVADKKVEAEPEFKVAMAPESNPVSNKPADGSTTKEPYTEKVGTQHKPVNEDNKQNLEKSLYDLKPAATTLPSATTQPPKVEPQPEVYTNRLSNIKPPATSRSTPENQPSQKSEPPSNRLQNIKPPAPAKTPSPGPKR